MECTYGLALPHILCCNSHIGCLADVLVTKLGVIHRGEHAGKYWSAGQSKYRYPYPVGFESETSLFQKRRFFSCVLEGAEGPALKVGFN